MQHIIIITDRGRGVTDRQQFTATRVEIRLSLLRGSL